MTADQFHRINALSEKVASKQATQREISEFHELLKLWNTSVEQNLIARLNGTF